MWRKREHPCTADASINWFNCIENNLTTPSKLKTLYPWLSISLLMKQFHAKKYR